MSKWMALLVLLATLAWTAQAQASPVTGDPFEAPLPLAGTWRALAADMAPAAADMADITAWHPVEVPGKWQGTALEGHRGMAWYGLDILLQPDGHAEGESLRLLLPPFLTAYEVYLNGQFLGSSGNLEPLRRGPNRHRTFEIPPELSRATSLRLRVRVHPGRFDGTFSASRPAGVALGRPGAIATLEELVASRVAQLPQFWAGLLVWPAFVGVALVTLLIFLLDRSRREYAWYTLMLLTGIATEYLKTGNVTGAAWHTQEMLWAQVLLSSLSATALFKTVAIMLDQKGKLVTAALVAPWLITPWAVTALVAPEVIHGSKLVLGYEMAVAVLVMSLGLALLVRAWRARHPDARVLTFGFALALGLQLALEIIFRAKGSLGVVGGWTGGLMVVMGVASAVSYLGTTAVVLALRYRRAFREVEQAHAASERFVPAAFLALLGRDNVVEVHRGDSSARQMTVMFSDIRGFTRMSERREPPDNFAFINRYLERMEPCIIENGGFINQYYGDGIMAMFTTADGALRAARAMQRGVDDFSDDLEREGDERLRVGVGIHTGSLMLGTIGGSTRLDTGVIGDAVNFTARVEGMTKQYGCRVLLSGAARRALDDPGAFTLREVDTNRAVGRKESMEVVQLVDAEDTAARDGVLANLERFARGLQAYREGAFDAATACFDEVLAKVDDGASRWLRDRSLAYSSEPPPQWDGVTVLEKK